MSAGQQPLDASGGADLGLPVRAVNRSEVTVVWEYDRAKHVLQPNTETFVPYMAMVYWQGDPRAIDVPGGRQHEQHRRNEHSRLRVLYGVYEESEGHNRWDDIPLVECYPINSDVRFETVLHDPDGLSVSASAESVPETQYLRRQMEDMASQMRVMQSRLAASEAQEAAVSAPGVDTEVLDRQETEQRVATPEEVGVSMVSPQPQRRPTPKGKTRDKATAVTRDGE